MEYSQSISLSQNFLFAQTSKRKMIAYNLEERKVIQEFETQATISQVKNFHHDSVLVAAGKDLLLVNQKEMRKIDYEDSFEIVNFLLLNLF